MTPEARAREIDRQEFEAESAATRERVMAAVELRRDAERKAWTNFVPSAYIPRRDFMTPPKATATPPVRRKKKPIIPRLRAKPDELHTANGLTMTRTEWAEHLGLTRDGMNYRVGTMGSLAAAVAAGPSRVKAKSQ